MALEKIQKANDIKELTEEELKELSDEIRHFFIEKDQCDRRTSGIQSRSC